MLIIAARSRMVGSQGGGRGRRVVATTRRLCFGTASEGSDVKY